MITKGTAPRYGVPQSCEGMRLNTLLMYVIATSCISFKDVRRPSPNHQSLTSSPVFVAAPLPMATLSPSVSAHSADESPSPSPNLHRSKSASEIQRDNAKIVFNKTIDGRYRHGRTGYRQVGALFLTWKDDDMQCKETEV